MDETCPHCGTVVRKVKDSGHPEYGYCSKCQRWVNLYVEK